MIGALAVMPACGEEQPADIEGATDGYDTAPGGTGEWDGCLYEPEEPYHAWRHRCEGIGQVRFAFDVVGAPGYDNEQLAHSVNLFFGGDSPSFKDSYEKPNVMACCSPVDDEEDLEMQPHYKACYHDMAENGCYSIWNQLKQAKKEAPVLARPQIQQIIDWFAAHTQDCYEEFWLESGASTYEANDPSDPPFILNHTWQLPSSAETLNIKNIEIEVSNLSITDAKLPADPNDWLMCESQKDNNAVSFLETDPDDGDVFELWDGSVELEGPDLGKGVISGFSYLRGTALGCDLCSLISTEFTEVGVTVEALVLDTEDPTEISDRSGSESMWLDEARIALYAPVHAQWRSANTISIPAGGATFVVSAMADGEMGMVTTTNATAIELELVEPPELPSAWYWELKPFTLPYRDASDETWEIEVKTSIFKQ